MLLFTKSFLGIFKATLPEGPGDLGHDGQTPSVQQLQQVAHNRAGNFPGHHIRINIWDKRSGQTSIFGTNLHRRAIPKYSSILDKPVAHFHPLGVLWRWQRRPHFHLLAALILQISSYSFNLQSASTSKYSAQAVAKLNLQAPSQDLRPSKENTIA